MKKRIWYICMLLLMMTGCQSQQKLVSVDRETNDVVLKRGQSCEIEFRTNASTGFWWQLLNESEITIVESGESRYETNAPAGMVGASSNRFWKFVAKEKGTQTLRFVYARDNVDEPIKTREVNVTVK